MTEVLVGTKKGLFVLAGEPGSAFRVAHRAFPGDVVECEIEQVGILRNPVISWEEAHGNPAPPLERW